MRCLNKAVPLLVAILVLTACHQEHVRGPVAETPPPGAMALPPPNPDKNAYFGDLHLHTSMSFDAFVMGTNTLPEDSYRYAMGEPVDLLGQKVRRHVPLDFLAVTDHSEYLGVLRIARDPNGPFSNTHWPKDLNPSSLGKATNDSVGRYVGSAALFGKPPIEEFRTPDLIRSNWQREIDAAEKYYRPGKFTTFVAYEWSSTPGINNLHRNVVFRGPKYPSQPFTAIDSLRPEDLWAYADHNRAQGIDSILIPHNSNLSNGLMFDVKDSDGQPVGRNYAETRARNERLVEIAQAKGASETRPELSPTDEFADFELLPMTSLSASFKQESVSNRSIEALAASFVRSAYARGLEIRARTGVNPYDFGIVGATDFHTGVSASEENNFPGAHGLDDTHQNPSKVLEDKSTALGFPAFLLSAGALTGVWAEQNTREAIFAALKRKETFGTSGDRMKARLFVGWNYPADILNHAGWVHDAYAGGVPQGSDLLAGVGTGKSPVFIVDAIKDPEAGNLDRIQIVKIWFINGQSHEKIFDAVWSGKRQPDPGTGKLPPVGNTVDVATATYTNTIGVAELIGTWIDPEFDPNAAANYYARVLAIPTPRWTTYLAVQNHLPLPSKVPAWIQERAWTSPVFYFPGNKVIQGSAADKAPKAS